MLCEDPIRSLAFLFLIRKPREDPTGKERKEMKIETRMKEGWNKERMREREKVCTKKATNRGLISGRPHIANSSVLAQV